MRPSGRRLALTETAPEFLVLARGEEFSGWLLDHTAKWPKSARFTLMQCIENHAFDIAEFLVEAHYEPRSRREKLARVNLLFERMRQLLRLARRANVQPRRGFETVMRNIAREVCFDALGVQELL